MTRQSEGPARATDSGPSPTATNETDNSRHGETPRALSAEQANELTQRGISVEFAHSLGVLSVQTAAELPADCPARWAEMLPALLIPWRALDGRVEWQIRPDNREPKYKSRSREEGYEPLLWVAKRGSDENGPHLLVEGTCQTAAAAEHAPEGTTVVGMLGCRGWSSEGVPLPDLALFEGKRTAVALDADMTTNRNVWDAAEALQVALSAFGPAGPIQFVRVPGSGKSGLDDVLGKVPAEKRAGYLARLIESAEPEKFPKSRRPKPKADPDAFFGDGGLRVETLSKDILKSHPAALTAEDEIALYENGVYKIDGLAFEAAVSRRLGEDHRPAHVKAAESSTRGTLHAEKKKLPDRVGDPLLNVKNGMLDLITAELLPQDPAYMSSVQIPVEWDPDAECPTYERWISLVGIDDQIDDLEESVSMMLDPSVTPPKAVLLYGPSKSGKSTLIRLLEAMVGAGNFSGVSLKQLCTNEHMAANVYGKMLNSSADLSATHVEDLSIFKMMTGEDTITGDRKFGKQFVFRNRALFAFSANELPTVGESSRAYSERIKPFRFAHSFAGHEDPSIERGMLDELPGILVRWVRAWQRRAERGAYLPTVPSVRAEFETKSNRVALWVAESMTVTSATPGRLLQPAQAMTKRALVTAFNEWARESHSSPMGPAKVISHLTSINGVVDVYIDGSSKVRGLNVCRRKGGDPWAGGEPPVAVVAELNECANSQKTKSSKGEDPSFSRISRNGSESATTATAPDPPAAGSSSTGPVADPCPKCGSPMLPPAGGRQWWLCSNRPDCKHYAFKPAEA